MSLRTHRRAHRSPWGPVISGFAAVVLALLTLLSATSASAATPSATAYIRVAHLVPGFGAVTMTATFTSYDGKTEELTLTPDAGYGAVSGYQALPVGSYAIAVRPVGAAATTPPVLTASLTATAGGAYTIAGLGSSTNPRIGTITDDIAHPAPGQARVRVIDAAVPDQSATVTVNGQPWNSPAQFATPTSYTDVAAGAISVTASSGGRTATTTLDFAAGNVYTVLLLDDGKGGISLRSVTDAAGASTTPVGGAATGGGGLATGSTGTLPLAAGGALAVVVGAGGLVVVARRRPQSRPGMSRLGKTQRAGAVRG